METSICKGRLRVAGKNVALPWPVVDFVDLNTVIVARVETPPGIIFNENVFGISKNGSVLWQISPMAHVYEDSPYLNLSRHENQVVVGNWDGAEAVIDPWTGVMISVKYTK